MGTADEQKNDVAVAKAMAWRDELKRRIGEADGLIVRLQNTIAANKKRVERIESFIAEWRNFAESALPDTAPQPAPDSLTARAEVNIGLMPATLNASATVSPPPPKRKATNNSKKEEVARLAREIIETRNEPVSRTDLYKELTEKRGLTIEGSDPEMVLSTMLWRMGEATRIVRLKNGGYWLAEKEHGPSGYWPEVEGILSAADPNPPGELVAQFEEPEPGP